MTGQNDQGSITALVCFSKYVIPLKLGIVKQARLRKLDVNWPAIRMNKFTGTDMQIRQKFNALDFFYLPAVPICQQETS